MTTPADITLFFDAFSGPEIPALDVGCGIADADADGDVDMRDFATVQAAW